MNCPVCNRNLAPTLSICLTCGAMVNDSVREELQTKITVQPKPVRFEAIDEDRPARPVPRTFVEPPETKRSVRKMPPAIIQSNPEKKVSVQAKPISAKPEPSASPITPAKPSLTAEINRQKTNRTLVEFQNKNSTVPDWRLQLQNVVRQRRGAGETETNDAVYEKRVITSGANALQAEFVTEAAPAPAPQQKDPRVAKALERIAASRKSYLPAEEPAKTQAEPSQARNFPFNVVSRTAAARPERIEGSPSRNVLPKPRLVSSIKMEKKALDTNKLPPLPDELLPVIANEASASVRTDEPRSTVSRPLERISGPLEETESMSDELIDDLPPMSMRFGAGLFDLIIGTFASLVLLLPLVFLGGNWFSMAGILAFVPTLAIVMFVYLTASLGFYGRSVGMRLFALELIDAEENEYPTLHQAAVNTSLYLITLGLAGLGFLSVFFNEERRAIHDLLSGTIIVKEF